MVKITMNMTMLNGNSFIVATMDANEVDEFVNDLHLSNINYQCYNKKLRELTVIGK